MKRAIGCGVVAVLVASGAGSAPGQPGEGIQPGGDVLVRPFADVSVSYDSNPLLLPDGQKSGDWFLDASPGLSVARPGETLRLDGSFLSRYRRFNEQTSEDRDDWSEELRLGLGHLDDWRMSLHERYGRMSDYDLTVRTTGAATGDTGTSPLSVVDRSERVDRDILDCGVDGGGPLSDKTSLDAAYSYGNIDYRNKDLLDSSQHKASAKAARKITDKSSAILVGDYVRMENDSLANPANYYAARAGWRWQGTFKSRIEGSAGYAALRMDDSDVGDTLDKDAYSYDLVWYWQLQPKLSMSLGGCSDMQLSPDSLQNAKLVNLVTGGAQYSATDRMRFGLAVGYRNEDFIRDEEVNGVLVSRETEQLHGRLRCDYRLLKWLGAYGEVWRENTQDNVGYDYQETRATLGVKAEY